MNILLTSFFLVRIEGYRTSFLFSARIYGLRFAFGAKSERKKLGP